MKSKTKSLLCGKKIILGVCLVCFCVPRLYAGHDTSLRTDLNFLKIFNEKIRFLSYAFVQANENVSKCNYVEWGTGLQYQTKLKWLSLLAYYQQGYSKNEDDYWLLEQSSSLNLNMQTLFNAFKISDQIRCEYRIKPGWHDYRIKNTLTISRPDVFLQPYTGWEIYYENQNKAIMLNRIKWGINRDLSKHISGGTYYRIDFSNISGQWEWTRQLIGFQITIK